MKIIKKIYHEAGGKPGYRMMRDLLANKGIFLSVQTVRKYMNVELGIKSVTRKSKYRYSKGPQAYAIFENLINQDFHAKKGMYAGVSTSHIFFCATATNDTIAVL